MKLSTLMDTMNFEGLSKYVYVYSTNVYSDAITITLNQLKSLVGLTDIVVEEISIEIDAIDNIMGLAIVTAGFDCVKGNLKKFEEQAISIRLQIEELQKELRKIT